jgi:hypothetical protein
MATTASILAKFLSEDSELTLDSLRKVALDFGVPEKHLAKYKFSGIADAFANFAAENKAFGDALGAVANFLDEDFVNTLPAELLPYWTSYMDNQGILPSKLTFLSDWGTPCGSGPVEA